MLVEMIYFSYFCLSVRRKGNTHILPLIAPKKVLQERKFMLQCQLSSEVHSTVSMKQQISSLEVVLLRRRPASSAVSSPSFPFLMTDISVVKGRYVVLQAEPKSLQILPKDRDFFLFFFSPNIYLLSQLWICFCMS